MIRQLLISYFLTVAFAILFNVSKKQLVPSGMAGAIGWLIYLWVGNSLSAYVAVWIATMGTAFTARIIAKATDKPITIFLIPGIFPLIPGFRFYNAISALVNGNNAEALSEGIQACKISIAIVLGIMVVVTVPQTLRKTASE